LERVARQAPEADISVHLERVSERAVRVTTNLAALGFSEAEADKHVESAVLAIGALHQTAEQMIEYHAVGELNDADLVTRSAPSLVGANSLEQQARLLRLRTVAELPDLGAAVERGELDLDRLIRLRNTKECTEFRTALSSIDRLSDADIADATSPLRTAISRAVHSGPGRVVRFLASSLPGFASSDIRVTVATTALGFVEAFLLERLVPKPGPLAFVNRLATRLGDLP
jgi:hypothetical protein